MIKSSMPYDLSMPNASTMYVHISNWQVASSGDECLDTFMSRVINITNFSL